MLNRCYLKKLFQVQMSLGNTSQNQAELLALLLRAFDMVMRFANIEGNALYSMQLSQLSPKET